MLFSWFQHAVGDVGLGRRAAGALVSESPDHMCCHEIGDRPRRMGANWNDSASEFHHYSYVVFQIVRAQLPNSGHSSSAYTL